jgi:predicted aspartyl protease
VLVALVAIFPAVAADNSLLGIRSSDPGGAMRTNTLASGCGSKLLEMFSIKRQDRAPTLRLSANGHPVTLLLDTGAERTILIPHAAKRIGAQAPRISFQRKLEGITNAFQTHEVELSSFSAERVPMPGRRVLVGPIALPQTAVPLDGVLGADLLAAFDLDLDLRHQRLMLYEKQSCPAAAPSWSRPYGALDVARSPDNQIFFSVRLDDHRFSALLDTGAHTTGLSKAAARSLGLSDAMLASGRASTIRGAGGETVDARMYRFSRLQVGGVTVANPELAVVDAILPNTEMILGTDVLSSMRLWLSYGSRRMFLQQLTPP